MLGKVRQKITESTERVRLLRRRGDGMSYILEEQIYNIDRKCWQNVTHEFNTMEEAESEGLKNLLAGITRYYEVFHS